MELNTSLSFLASNYEIKSKNELNKAVNKNPTIGTFG